MRNSNNNKNKKNSYKGGFIHNPKLPIEETKRKMRPINEGPTSEPVSTLNSTVNTDSSENETTIPPPPKRKRPSPKKKKNSIGDFFTKDITVGIIITLVIAGGGIFIYTHSNQLVSIEKDVEHIKDDVKDIDDKTEKVKETTHTLDKRIELLNQKFDLEDKRKGKK